MLCCAPKRSITLRVVAALVAALVGFTLLADAPASAATADDEALLFQLTNQSRAQNGRAPLAYDPLASNVARAWSQGMARSQNMQHNPNLVAQVDAQVTNQWTRLGENVGYAGGITQVHNAYLNSPHHFDNIVGPYNRVGIGTTRDSAGKVWTTLIFLSGPALPVVSQATFAPFGSAAQLVNQQYVDFLGRNGDDAGLVSWTSSLMAGWIGPAGVVSAFMGSPEFGSLVAPVARLYIAYFGRYPDAAGLFHWVTQLRTGASLAAVSNAFAGSTEFRNLYGTLTNNAFVDRVYQNVLGRSSDVAGLTYWVGRLLAGLLDRGGVMLGFSESAEYRNATWARVNVVMAYLGMLRRAPDPAGVDYWVGQLNAGLPLANLLGGIMGSAEYRNRF